MKLTILQLVEVLSRELGKRHVFFCGLPDGTTEVDVPDMDYSAALEIIREAGYEIISECDFQGSSWNGFKFIIK